MTIIAGLSQDLQIAQDILVGVVEAQAKAYSVSNTIDDTDFFPLGPVVDGTLDLPHGKTIDDLMTGLPSSIKKSVVTHIAQTVTFQVWDDSDQTIDLAIGAESMVLTYGATTTINDTTPAANNADLTSTSGLSVGDYLEITTGGIKYYATISDIAGSTVTWTPDLPVTPANGSAIKQVLKSEHNIGGKTLTHRSLRFICTDQNGNQVIHFVPKFRAEVDNTPILEMGDATKPAKVVIKGKSIPVTMAVGSRDEPVALQTQQRRGSFLMS